MIPINEVEFQPTPKGDGLIGTDTDNGRVYKIRLNENPKKANTLEEEYEILKLLNKKNCLSAPKAYECGEIRGVAINKALNHNLAEPEQSYFYYSQEYLPDTGDFTLPDVVLAIIEQKQLGVYHGDIKPSNIRFSSSDKICKLIDYDQSVVLPEAQITSPNTAFFDWLDTYEQEYYGHNSWLRHFNFDIKNSKHLLSLDFFFNDSFDLASTQIYQTQRTTNSATGIYHSLTDSRVFLEGSRPCAHRLSALDQVEFQEGESVLDVGCNSGLLSLYLSSRGCNVTGVDNDEHIIYGATAIANILGHKIFYQHVDLDLVPALPKVDTVMLFSVLHHTRDVVNNAKKISESTSRIIIESRLTERGSQPDPNSASWLPTCSWDFSTEGELVELHEKLFSGFKLHQCLGISDKNRHLHEYRLQ